MQRGLHPLLCRLRKMAKRIQACRDKGQALGLPCVTASVLVWSLSAAWGKSWSLVSGSAAALLPLCRRACRARETQLRVSYTPAAACQPAEAHRPDCKQLLCAWLPSLVLQLCPACAQ